MTKDLEGTEARPRACHVVVIIAGRPVAEAARLSAVDVPGAGWLLLKGPAPAWAPEGAEVHVMLEHRDAAVVSAAAEEVLKHASVLSAYGREPGRVPALLRAAGGLYAAASAGCPEPARAELLRAEQHCALRAAALEAAEGLASRIRGWAAGLGRK